MRSGNSLRFDYKSLGHDNILSSINEAKSRSLCAKVKGGAFDNG